MKYLSLSLTLSIICIGNNIISMEKTSLTKTSNLTRAYSDTANLIKSSNKKQFDQKSVKKESISNQTKFFIDSSKKAPSISVNSFCTVYVANCLEELFNKFSEIPITERSSLFYEKFQKAYQALALLKEHQEPKITTNLQRKSISAIEKRTYNKQQPCIKSTDKYQDSYLVNVPLIDLAKEFKMSIQEAKNIVDAIKNKQSNTIKHEDYNHNNNLTNSSSSESGYETQNSLG